MGGEELFTQDRRAHSRRRRFPTRHSVGPGVSQAAVAEQTFLEEIPSADHRMELEFIALYLRGILPKGMEKSHRSFQGWRPRSPQPFAAVHFPRPSQATVGHHPSRWVRKSPGLPPPRSAQPDETGASPAPPYGSRFEKRSEASSGPALVILGSGYGRFNPSSSAAQFPRLVLPQGASGFPLDQNPSHRLPGRRKMRPIPALRASVRPIPGPLQAQARSPWKTSARAAHAPSFRPRSRLNSSPDQRQQLGRRRSRLIHSATQHGRDIPHAALPIMPGPGTAGSFRFESPASMGSPDPAGRRQSNFPEVLKRFAAPSDSVDNGLQPHSQPGRCRIQTPEAHRTGHLNTFVGYREIPGELRSEIQADQKVPISPRPPLWHSPRPICPDSKGVRCFQCGKCPA